MDSSDGKADDAREEKEAAKSDEIETVVVSWWVGVMGSCGKQGNEFWAATSRSSSRDTRSIGVAVRDRTGSGTVRFSSCDAWQEVMEAIVEVTLIVLEEAAEVQYGTVL